MKFVLTAVMLQLLLIDIMYKHKFNFVPIIFIINWKIVEFCFDRFDIERWYELRRL